MSRVRKEGITVPLRTDTDGTPLHPETGVRMVETEPGVWADPLLLSVERELADGFSRMVDAMIARQAKEEGGHSLTR